MPHRFNPTSGYATGVQNSATCTNRTCRGIYVILARNPTSLYNLSFSLSLFSVTLFVFLTETRGAQRESAETDQKDIACRPLVSFSLRFVPFFLVIRISINLVVVPASFLSSRLCHRGRCPRTCRPVLGGIMSFSLDKFTRAEKNYTRMIAFFSCIFYYSLEDIHDIVSREGRVTDQSDRCVSRIHYAASHHFFPSLCNLIKLTVTHLVRVSYLNFFFAPVLLNFLSRSQVTICFVLCVALSRARMLLSSLTFEGQTISAL